MSALANATSFSGALHGCAEGGVVIEVGMDLNQNSVLDANEITDQSAVCNGVATQTTPRTDAWLTKVTVEHFVVMDRTPYATCTEYRTIQQGFDNSTFTGLAGNGILDIDEVEVQTEMCVTVNLQEKVNDWFDSENYHVGPHILATVLRPKQHLVPMHGLPKSQWNTLWSWTVHRTPLAPNTEPFSKGLTTAHSQVWQAMEYWILMKWKYRQKCVSPSIYKKK